MRENWRSEDIRYSSYFSEVNLFARHLKSCACMHAKSLQSCPTLCDPKDCSPQGSSVQGILQARYWSRFVIPFSRGSSHPRIIPTSLGRLVLYHYHHHETELDPGGSWEWNPFCVPHFLFVGNRFQSPGPSLSSKTQVQAGVNQVRERMQKQVWSRQEAILQLWEGIWVPPQGTHVTVSLSSSAELKTPANGRCWLLDEASFRDQEATWGQIKGMWPLKHTLILIINPTLEPWL